MLGATDDPAEQAEHVLRVIRELGLQPYEAPEPLPEITDDDVHLICWLALVQATSESRDSTGAEKDAEAARRRAALDEMTRDAEDLGLYD